MTSGSIVAQITDYANRADPYPLYAELRKTPVRREDDGTYLVSTYYEVRSLANDPRLSNDTSNRPMRPWPPRATGGGQWPAAQLHLHRPARSRPAARHDQPAVRSPAQPQIPRRPARRAGQGRHRAARRLRRQGPGRHRRRLRLPASRHRHLQGPGRAARGRTALPRLGRCPGVVSRSPLRRRRRPGKGTAGTPGAGRLPGRSDRDQTPATPAPGFSARSPPT